jgi:hypothetical protein
MDHVVRVIGALLKVELGRRRPRWLFGRGWKLAGATCLVTLGWLRGRLLSRTGRHGGRL